MGINPQICWNFSSQPITGSILNKNYLKNRFYFIFNSNFQSLLVIAAIDFSPDGTLFAVSSRDGKCRIINANTNRYLFYYHFFFSFLYLSLLNGFESKKS